MPVPTTTRWPKLDSDNSERESVSDTRLVYVPSVAGTISADFKLERAADAAGTFRLASGSTSGVDAGDLQRLYAYA